MFETLSNTLAEELVLYFRPLLLFLFAGEANDYALNITFFTNRR